MHKYIHEYDNEWGYFVKLDDDIEYTHTYIYSDEYKDEDTDTDIYVNEYKYAADEYKYAAYEYKYTNENKYKEDKKDTKLVHINKSLFIYFVLTLLIYIYYTFSLMIFYYKKHTL